MNNLKWSKTSQVDGEKNLYAIIDEFNHTVIQVWEKEPPIEFIKSLQLVVKEKEKV